MLRSVVESFERGVRRHGAQRGGREGAGERRNERPKGQGGGREGGAGEEGGKALQSTAATAGARPR